MIVTCKSDTEWSCKQISAIYAVMPDTIQTGLSSNINFSSRQRRMYLNRCWEPLLQQGYVEVRAFHRTLQCLLQVVASEFQPSVGFKVFLK